jgi:hypothetical protein
MPAFLVAMDNEDNLLDRMCDEAWTTLASRWLLHLDQAPIDGTNALR